VLKVMAVSLLRRPHLLLLLLLRILALQKLAAECCLHCGAPQQACYHGVPAPLLPHLLPPAHRYRATLLLDTSPVLLLHLQAGASCGMMQSHDAPQGLQLLLLVAVLLVVVVLLLLLVVVVVVVLLLVLTVPAAPCCTCYACYACYP
jgi:hypothetical protein